MYLIKVTLNLLSRQMDDSWRQSAVLATKQPWWKKYFPTGMDNILLHKCRKLILASDLFSSSQESRVLFLLLSAKSLTVWRWATDYRTPHLSSLHDWLRRLRHSPSTIKKKIIKHSEINQNEPPWMWCVKKKAQSRLVDLSSLLVNS